MQYKNFRIRCILAMSVSLLLLAASCAAQESFPGSATPNTGSTAPYNQNGEPFAISPSALQVAQIIGVEPLIARLSELTSAKDIGAEPSRSVEELLLRQQITDSIVAASLDIDSVLNKIDYEMQQTVE